jgi:hypothetical protein
MGLRVSKNLILPRPESKRFTEDLLKLIQEMNTTYHNDLTYLEGRLTTNKTPASATDTGEAGEICYDSGFLYVCVATNSWKRVAIASW